MLDCTAVGYAGITSLRLREVTEDEVIKIRTDETDTHCDNTDHVHLATRPP